MRPTSFLPIIAIVTATVANADDLSPLSDEFNDPSNLADWQRVYDTEGWGFDQLEAWDIGQTSAGRMTMMPYTSSWYAEFRGVQTYKSISGDFVVTTDVEPTNRAETGPPSTHYSLAGIMVRSPRAIANGQADWTPNGENYIFLSLGTASNPGTYQFEVKTTVNSNSQLEIEAGAPRARIQIARIGSAFIALRRFEGGEWTVHRRYRRADMPDTLNVGLTTYTDWNTCNAAGANFHNQNLLDAPFNAPGGGSVTPNPDLTAKFDYVRFRRPAVPAALAGRDFTNPSQVSDAELLAFLGASADRPRVEPPVLAAPTNEDAARIQSDGFPVRFTVPEGVEGIVESSADGVEWGSPMEFIGTSGESEIVDTSAAQHPHRIYRIRISD